MSDAIDVSDKTKFAMPVRNLLSLIASVGVGVWAYFGIIERLNRIETNNILIQADLIKNTEFRIKWPRGQLGALPADSEHFMMIEDLYKTTDKINKHVEDMALNKVNIEFLRKQMDKVLEDIEKLKDQNREIKYNGNGTNN